MSLLVPFHTEHLKWNYYNEELRKDDHIQSPEAVPD